MNNGFYGNFSTWSEALDNCYGYNNLEMLEKIKSSVLKVKNGEAVYERDSFLFDKIEYSYPLLTYLLFIASASGNKLNVADFGGSLGTSFFQCRNFLTNLNLLKWNVVEQKHFVDCGKKYIEGNEIKFFYDMEVCVNTEKPNILLISGVLQSLESPYQMLEKLIRYGIDYIIIDRTLFFDEPDRITIQCYPSGENKATFPAWFFNYTRFLNCIEKLYDKVDSTDSFESYTFENGVRAQSQVMLFTRKN